MRIDLDGAPDRTRFESAVCIVGGGIAGLLLAHRLATDGIDVHLLEAGGPKLESRSQELYRVEMEGRYHHGATEGRFRVFGGSSTMWGGQLLPYTPDIFSPPCGTPSAPWPLTTADIEPHYAALEKIMHVSPSEIWRGRSEENAWRTGASRFFCMPTSPVSKSAKGAASPSGSLPGITAAKLLNFGPGIL